VVVLWLRLRLRLRLRLQLQLASVSHFARCEGGSERHNARGSAAHALTAHRYAVMDGVRSNLVLSNR
jgi:hypothetical protein